MERPLFDSTLRAMRRDRAFRAGPELFLLERAFSDLLGRLSLIKRRFERALLIGCPDPGWRRRLEAQTDMVDVVDPGQSFAEAADGIKTDEDRMELPSSHYDLCLALGTLDTVNDLPAALLNIRTALEPDALFLGVASGGDTLPQLRAAMRAADREMGFAAPHVHPRIEPAALGALLAASGFVMPVVDLDRVSVRYANLFALVRDLRAMAATNLLAERSRSALSRRAAAAAAAHFESVGNNGRTSERFELLHFAAWTGHQG